jgi:hypothetical protein
MRSTNTQRLSVCVSAASGQQEATTLGTLNLRVAQVYAGRTKAERQIKRTTAEISASVAQNGAQVYALAEVVNSRLAAMRLEKLIWPNLSLPSASGPSAADRGVSP